MAKFCQVSGGRVISAYEGSIHICKAEPEDDPRILGLEPLAKFMVIAVTVTTRLVRHLRPAAILPVKLAPVVLAASYPPMTRFPSICEGASAPVKPQNTDHVLEAISLAATSLFKNVELLPTPIALIEKSLPFRLTPSGKPWRERLELSCNVSDPKTSPLLG